MSKAEILEELASLTPDERREIVARIQELEDDKLTEEEKRILDRELEEYRKNPEDGSPWEEVEARIRGSLKR
jgi:putative addiction module component (TIGR02574 family)